MKTLLPPVFDDDIRAIDSLIGEIMDEKLDFTDRFLYEPTTISAHLIARTFDIDINNLTLNQAKQLLKTPMLSKRRLGTKEAIKDGISKIFSEVVIQTNKEDKKLKPFEFSIKSKITQNINEETIKAINNIILEVKPLRDNLAGIDFTMPLLHNDIHLKTAIQWRL